MLSYQKYDGIVGFNQPNSELNSNIVGNNL